VQPLATAPVDDNSHEDRRKSERISEPPAADLSLYLGGYMSE